MIYHWKVQQKSDEWYELRALKMTGSHATAIGNAGKGLEAYCREIVCNSIVKPENYISKDMERGNTLEPIARLKYELEYNCTVQQIGFITYNEFVGVSPDGLIGLDGMLELKARGDKVHFGLILGDSVDSSSIWQMNMQMLVTGRKWCDYGSYNPNFKTSLFVKRFYADEQKHKALLKGFEVGESLIKKLLAEKYIQIELSK